MNSELNQANKKLVWAYWEEIDAASVKHTVNFASKFLSENAQWFGPDPINILRGPSAIASGYYRALKESFPDLKRETHIFIGGRSSGHVNGLTDEKMWVGGTGYLHATFSRDYLEIPATGEPVKIRWGEFCRIEENRIVEVYLLLDLVDLIQQAGYQLLPASKGRDHLYPAPAANDGILHGAQDDAESEYSLDHIRRFIFDGLNSFDQEELESMGMADYFHPDVQWYGPGGIGACLSLKEFEDLHQQPWLVAFPDRQVQDLTALIAEGSYTGAPGWSGVKATHTGPYLDSSATNRPVHFNGIDFWKRDGEQYIENWVFVDMIHLFRQFGIDLFSRLKKQLSTGKSNE